MSIYSTLIILSLSTATCMLFNFSEILLDFSELENAFFKVADIWIASLKL